MQAHGLHGQTRSQTTLVVNFAIATPSLYNFATFTFSVYFIPAIRGIKVVAEHE